MMNHGLLLALGLVLAAFLPGCAPMTAARSGGGGHLLIIGGGLDDDIRPVYERLLKLASAHGPPRLVIATAATEPGYDERSELTGKTEALRAWAPSMPVEIIRRGTSTADAVAAMDRATGILFTGGSQARITGRYRPAGRDTAELLAMRRLLDRGGVIAGCSAGDAMMGEFMLLGGDNARALGAAPAQGRERTGELRIGPGMAFLPWAITDSHFFERNRAGRLVAALETSGRRLGIGVGEDAAVEVDLARGEVIGVSVSDSLIIDAASLERDGPMRRNLRARLIRQGDRISLRRGLSAKPPAPQPASPRHVVHLASPSQNRQLALWRLFMGASRPGSGVWEINFDEGWRLVAWPDGDGGVIFDAGPAPAPQDPLRRNVIPWPGD